MDLNNLSKNDTFRTASNHQAPHETPLPQSPKRAPRPSAAPHKRPHHETYYDEPPAKRAAPCSLVGSDFKWDPERLAAAADAVESGRSPVSALNELGVHVVYETVREGGPAHSPSFTVTVSVADLRFEGSGHSKKEARTAAARACLTELLARVGRVMPEPNPQQDFANDEPHRFPESKSQCLEPAVKAQTPPEPAPLPEPNRPDVATCTSGGGAGVVVCAALRSPFSRCTCASAALKSPISVLYENYTELAFTYTYGDGSPLSETEVPLQLSHSMRFKVVCQIRGQKFEGYGSSKKLAKAAAARSAVAALGDLRDDSHPVGVAPLYGALRQDQTLADHIGKLVNEKFNELMKDDVLHSKRKVLAGIVITTSNRIEDARVIAVTTGTKCVSGEHMSLTGRAVNDCHAEVAARRCLQRHLYQQLFMYANQPDPTVPIEENDLEPLPGGGYQLKPSRGVHLYVSTAPCGDGRIFSAHEDNYDDPDRHPNRLARGQLRTKIESGEGTIPVKNCNVLQTWDGIMQGERLLTMSCSDKVARWSVCGLQGALLSSMLRPVYLESLVLGSMLHAHHMYRAICGRYEAYISYLPPPFRLQRPMVARAAIAEPRMPSRAPPFGVSWCATDQGTIEVINAATGKLEHDMPSQLCKQAMFARWHYLVKKLPLLPQDVEDGILPQEMPDKPEALLYNEAKQMCTTYQLAKQSLIEAFEKANLGRWIKRPLEQDQFVCEIMDANPSLLFAWAGPNSAAFGDARDVRGPSVRTNSDSTVDSGEASDSTGYSGDASDSTGDSGEASDSTGGSGEARVVVADHVLGARSQAYYNYRNSTTDSLTNNNSCSDDEDDYWEGLDSDDDYWKEHRDDDDYCVGLNADGHATSQKENMKEITRLINQVLLSDDEYDLSDSVFEDVDVNNHSLGLRTRDSIRPRSLGDKADQSSNGTLSFNVNRGSF